MKKLALTFLSLALSISISSCKNVNTEDVDVDDMDHAHEEGMEHDEEHMDDETSLMVGKELMVSLASKSGSNVSGMIEFMQTEDEVVMEASLSGLEPGSHAIHIHENGDCSSDDGKSAGGHWDPTTEDHGKWGDAMHHSGDIGNLEADADGNASITFSTDKWCISCDDAKRNIVGKGIIVHAKADDFTSQPSGAAGTRVACGVIE